MTNRLWVSSVPSLGQKFNEPYSTWASRSSRSVKSCSISEERSQPRILSYLFVCALIFYGRSSLMMKFFKILPTIQLIELWRKRFARSIKTLKWAKKVFRFIANIQKSLENSPPTCSASLRPAVIWNRSMKVPPNTCRGMLILKRVFVAPYLCRWSFWWQLLLLSYFISCIFFLKWQGWLQSTILKYPRSLKLV